MEKFNSGNLGVLNKSTYYTVYSSNKKEIYQTLSFMKAGTIKVLFTNDHPKLYIH